jgi:hypothetical protein
MEILASYKGADKGDLLAVGAVATDITGLTADKAGTTFVVGLLLVVGRFSFDVNYCNQLTI